MPQLKPIIQKLDLIKLDLSSLKIQISSRARDSFLSVYEFTSLSPHFELLIHRLL